jgi:hypothetical protein
VHEHERLALASFFCNQARLGEHVEFDFLRVNKSGFSPVSFKGYVWFSNTHWLRLLVLVALVCLAFFETPMWCWNLASCNEKWVPIALGNSNVSVPGVLNASVIADNATEVLVSVPRSFFPLMPPMASLGVETGCLIVLLLFDSALSLTFTKLESWIWSDSLESLKCFFLRLFAGRCACIVLEQRDSRAIFVLPIVG